MQTLELMQRGAWGYALANMVSSLLLCLAAAAIGYYAGLWLNR
jgi:fluoride ion exporter CrcB/FEX